MRSQLKLYGLSTIGLAAALVFAVPGAYAACVGGTANGVLESGEQCDGGADPDDCCTSSCTFAADNTLCNDNNDCSVNTKCDASGDCGGGTGAPNGTTCRQRDTSGVPQDCKSYACSGKACTSTIVSDPCTDGNACTTDTCDDPTTNPPTCSASHPSLPENAPCDSDLNACTVETCNAVSVCTFQSTVDCSGATPAPGVCEFYACDPGDGSCDLKDKPKGTSCTSDGNDCSDDECNSLGVCKHFAVNAGLPCNDGNACSIGEQCDAHKHCGPAGTAYEGTAGNAGASCTDDGNVCTYDYCTGTSVTCSHSGTAYSGGGTTNGNTCPTDFNVCTEDFCNSGVCAHAGTNPFTSATSDGVTCTDNNACTATSACSAGSCLGTSCTTGVCSIFCGAPACSTTLPSCGCSG